MAEFILEEPSESNMEGGPIPDDEVLTAEVIKCALVEKTARNTGEKYKRVEFAFAVNDPNTQWDGRKLYGDVGANFIDHPDCKLRNWVIALMNSTDDLPVGFKFDTTDLIGLPCRIVVGARQYTKDGEERVYNFAKDVMPPRGVTAATASQVF